MQTQNPLRLSAASALTAALLGLGAAAPAVALDRIYLADGKIVEDVKIVSETVEKVLYKPEKGRGEKEVASENVLSVEFTVRPQGISESETDANNGALLGAISGFQTYLGSEDSRTQKKYPWAAPYARFRLVELQEQRGAIEDMVAAVDDLIATNPDSRYVPVVMIKKVEAQILGGDMAGAKATTDTFKAFVADKGLPLRWEFEVRVRETLVDASLTGTKLESALDKLSREAAAFPTVSNRADVAAGESMLNRGAFEEAESTFEGVVEAPGAGDRTLAAAWTGLGDCLYRKAEAKASSGKADDAKALFEEARMAFMRVVVLHKTELAYVPKAAFFAGRCFQEIGGEGANDSSRRLFRYVMSNFRGSRWYDSARDFDRRN